RRQRRCRPSHLGRAAADRGALCVPRLQATRADSATAVPSHCACLRAVRHRHHARPRTSCARRALHDRRRLRRARRRHDAVGCARQHWLAKRAAAVTSVLIFPKAAISGTATTSCTKREEHALTVTFEPITEALAPERIDALITAALAEDIGAGDVTTDAVIPM